MPSICPALVLIIAVVLSWVTKRPVLEHER